MNDCRASCEIAPFIYYTFIHLKNPNKFYYEKNVFICCNPVEWIIYF